MPVVMNPSVATKDDLALLFPNERDYVVRMKRKDRLRIGYMITTKRFRAQEQPLRIQLLQSRLPDDAKLRIFDELGHRPCDKYTNWARQLIQLPLGVRCQVLAPDVTAAVAAAKKTMDDSVTGHEDAKREILKLVCQSHVTGSCASNYSLGFEGPPGTGKTHFVKTALAPALGRPMVSIPLGGANDVAYLLGHLYAYEGSREGRLANALIETGCSNPIIYFDEVDKISATERGTEISSVLIHLVDPTANKALRDRYFHGVDIDFSHCTFIFSYNDPSLVSPVLLDRIKRIKMPAPSEAEQRTIVRDHLVHRVQKRLHSTVELSDGAVDMVLRNTAPGQGMRGAEQDVDHLLASAQLALKCRGAIAGVDAETDVCDEGGCISASFAQRMLSKRDDLHEAPPVNMYL